ncbi:MAG: hypothetical protein JWM33_3022 [Caulobacteraceae bacterium]|nr:hypothetical protein [Caulobacteraceae bacterium]
MRWGGAILSVGLVVAVAPAGAPAEAAQPTGPDDLPSQVVGVVGSGDQLALRLRQGSGERLLKVGDAYADDWILTALSPTMASLSKGWLSRTIGLNPTGAVAALAGAGAPASQVAVVGEGAIERAADASRGWVSCLAEYRAKTGQDLNALRDRTQALPVMGKDRYDQCLGYTEVMSAARTDQERRAIALARGDLNGVRLIDGLPPLGPDKITTAKAASYSDVDFAPGTFTTAGYSHGGILADGSYYNYRTIEARQAAIAAGEEPPMTIGMTLNESAAAYNAWIAAHPASSAK